MKVRVVKETGGALRLVVISEGQPPLSPVIYSGLTAKAVAKACRETLSVIEFERAGGVPKGHE